MPNTDPNNYSLLALFSLIKDAVLGLLGGLVAYLFDYSKSEKKAENGIPPNFKTSSMFIHMFLGAFVGFVCGTLIPADTFGRVAIVALSGVSSFNLLMLVESRFASWLFERMLPKKLIEPVCDALLDENKKNGDKGTGGA